MNLNRHLTVVVSVWLSLMPTNSATADDLQALANRMTKKAFSSSYGEGMLADCNRLLAADPTCKRFRYIYTVRAMAYRDDGENEKALKDLEMTKKLGQIEHNYYLTHSCVLQSMGRMAEALPDYDMMLKETPNAAWLYHSRAASLEVMNKPEAALADLAKAVSIEPRNTKFISSHARLLERLHRYDAAIADYTRLLKMAPDDETTLFMRGKVYAAQGKNKEALADFTRAIENDQVPTRTVYLSRAAVYDKLGQPAKAISDRKTAAELR